MLSAAAATSILSLSSVSAFATSEANGQTQDSSGILSGNTVQAPVEVPVNVCGNSVNAVGAANPAADNSCGNSSAPAEHHPGPSHRPSGPAATERAEHRTTGTTRTSGASAHGEAVRSSGALSGNNVMAPVKVPVNVCGNHVGVVSIASGAMGGDCVNGDQRYADTPPGHATKPGPGPGPRPRPRTESGPHAAHEVSTSKASKASKASADSKASEAFKASKASKTPEPPKHEPQTTRSDDPVGEAAPGAQLAATGMDAALLGAAAGSAGLLLGGAILYRRRFATSPRR
ncbi:chaplin [Streptomyces sp. NPDC003032]